MLSKGAVCESIAGILKKYGNASLDSLLKLLVSLQNQRNIPIVPITIENEILQSEYVESCIMDMHYLRTIKKNELISITNKGLNLYIDQNIDYIENYDLGEQYLRDFILMIKGQKFKVHTQVDMQTYNFCRLLPLIPEIGALFSISNENIIFKKCIPLFYNDNTPSISYLLFNDVDSDINETHIKNNIKRMKGPLYHFLQDKFNPKIIENCMTIIFYYLLPISTSYLNYSCTNNHEVNILKDNYIDSFLSPIETTCSRDDCMSKVSRLKYKLINEPIYDAWKNGILMEWYASKLLKQITNNKSYYNIDIDNVQCDSFSFDEDYVYLIECKRINSYNSKYNEGVKQLNNLKKIFKKKGINTKTILFTTINDSPKSNPDIDLIITQENFLEFSQNPSL